MSPSGERTVVVGGGIIGAMCAYFLVRSGRQVTLLEEGEFGRACSHGNCGFVCPSHALPLAMPGAISSTVKALLRRNSPFAIKPRLSPALWSFLWNFSRRCNRRDMLTSATARYALLRSSMDLYESLISDERIDCEWQARGLLFVYQTEHHFEEYAATDSLLRETFGLAARKYSAVELAQLEPALKPGLAGAWHYEGDRHLRPDKLMAELRSVLLKLGVAIEEHTAVSAIRRESNIAKAAVTNRGEFEADVFLVATGALTPLLNQQTGCRIAIQPGKGYSITMPRPGLCPQIPLIFEEHRVAITPMRSGYRIGSTMEFAGYDRTINPKRLALLKNGAKVYLHEPYSDPVQETWYGWRPMTADGKPYLGQSPTLPNVYLAAGHNMLGLSMAPATGKLMAELINREPPHIDPEPYRVDR